MEKRLLEQEEIRVEILNDKNVHLIAGFESKVCRELENFLKENAWEEHKIDFSKTYLFFHNNVLVGYVTILMDRQPLKIEYPHQLLSAFKEKTENGYSAVPALKIGRMCVIDCYNSQLESTQYHGLGSIILASVIGHAIQLKSRIGCRVITTHAKKDTNAYRWYEKLGFVFSHCDEKIKEMLARDDIKAVPMFYDINRIIK